MKITYKQEILSTDQLSDKQILNKLLSTRGIANMEEFLCPIHPSQIDLTQFGYTQEIEDAYAILKKMHEEKKMVVVYTDYDADGITGGSILWETLHLLGFKVMPYVPHRQHDGYGFSIKGIDSIKKDFDPGLIISVDHGIAAPNQVTYAKSIGIPIIITDHHHKQEKIPEDAVAIFHIPLLSGSGVSYFFSKQIFHYFKTLGRVHPKALEILEHNFAHDYLALASIGTIADLVPLVGPSRSVAKYGLDGFDKVNRCGIRQIIKEAGIEGKKITPFEIGFVIAPRINAIGRLEHAIDALRLLCTNNEERAQQLAEQVGDINKQRQDLVKNAVEEALKQVEEKKQAGSLAKMILLTSETWHEGIIGLIASRVVEQYTRPTLIMTKADGFYKGSARSIASFHVTNFLTNNSHFFLNFGGHAQAAGFSIPDEKLNEFIKEAEKQANEMIKDEDMIKTIDADMKIPLSKVNIPLVKLIEDLQPFGIGNPKPIFYSEAQVMDAQLMGKSRDHLKVYVKDPAKGSFPIEMIAFSAADKIKGLSKGKKAIVVYELEINRWGNTERLQGKLKHIE